MCYAGVATANCQATATHAWILFSLPTTGLWPWPTITMSVIPSTAMPLLACLLKLPCCVEVMVKSLALLNLHTCSYGPGWLGHELHELHNACYAEFLPSTPWCTWRTRNAGCWAPVCSAESAPAFVALCAPPPNACLQGAASSKAQATHECMLKMSVVAGCITVQQVNEPTVSALSVTQISSLIQCAHSVSAAALPYP